MKKTLSIAALTASLFVTFGANACAWHAGGFGDGAFGMQWREYSDEELNALIEATYNRNKEGQQSSADAADQKARPTFSSSAARAAQTAQSNRAEAEESAAASSDDSASE
ncbi:MAG: hypothetical protein AAFU65_10940 [Pseudomonadota bacterium]